VAFEPNGSPRVCSAIGVLTAVNFNDQAVPERYEVGNIGADWTLPAKLVPGEVAMTQQQP
jgi:hypothetical protein